MTIAETPLPLLGQVLGERYRLDGILGEGGMGVVYRAKDLATGRTVALKTIRGLGPTELFRLKHEFRSLVDIVHPNLVRLHDLTVTGGSGFFTMEHVEGVDFVTWVQRGTTADERVGRCRGALAQLAGALGAIHARGKIHRDVKPSNVLVADDGRVTVLDFGLVHDVRSADSAASSEAALGGTIAYMAPEVASGAKLGPSADWYSTGVMLYEALTGRLPFPGSPIESLFQRGRITPTRPTLLVPEIPAELDDLVVALLDPSPERRPGAAAVAACARAGAAVEDAAPAPERPAGEGVLIGRDAELAALDEALAASRVGAAMVVLVEGPSGIGKTSLLERAAAGFEARRNALVLRAVCHPREHVPFKAVDGILDALSRFLARQRSEQASGLLPRHAAVLARVFPVFGRVPAIGAAAAERLPPEPQELRRLAFQALRELLARVADTRAVVLWIDDLQWGDVDGIRLLREVLRPPDAPRVLLIASHRRDDLERTAVHRALVDVLLPVLTSLRELELAPLSQDDSRRLASAVLGSDEHPLLEHVVREAVGVPLLVTELARELAASPRALAGAPPTIEGLLAARLALLGGEASRLLEAVAVAGHPLGERAAALAGEIEGELGGLVGALQDARLVRSVPAGGGPGLTTYHDHVRQAVLARLSPERRAEIHARIATALESSASPDPELLVEHYTEAGQRDAAARCAYAAARNAEHGLAFNRAASLYRRALELGWSETPRWRLRERLGDALINAGHAAAGARQLLEAADGAERDGADSVEVVRMRRRAAEYLLRSYRRDEGLAVMRDVLRRFALPFPTSPRLALATMLVNRARWRLLRRFGRAPRDESAPLWIRERMETCWSAGLGFSIFDIFRASDYQARHALLAWKSGDPAHLARAVSAEAQIMTWEGGEAKRRRARELHAEAAEIARGLDDPRVEAHRMLMSCVSALAEGRHRDVLVAAEKGIEVCRERCRGSSWELASLQNAYTTSLVLKGEFARLWQVLPEMLREADERDDRFAFVMFRIGPVNAAWLATGGPERASAELAAATAEPTTNPWILYQVEYARAQIALYRGAPEAAWPGLCAVGKVLGRSQMLRLMLIRKFYWEIVARTAVALAAAGASPGRVPWLRRATRAIVKVARRDAPGFEPRIDLLRAAIDALSGDPASARLRLECAAAGFERVEEGIGTAAAQHALGGLVGGTAGARLRDEGFAWLAAHGAAEPARLAAVWAPGLADGVAA